MASIIDGYTGKPNIYAEDIGKHNISLYGSGDYVLQVGECIGYEIISNNEIKIKDGMFLIQGRRGIIKNGTEDTCIIENGAQAVKRNDLIVIEYKKDESTQIESHTTKVIKGTPGETATDPEIATGNIQNGAVLHQMPLYRVKIEGLNIVAVEQMFEFGSVAAEAVDPMLATKEGFVADALATKKQFEEQYKIFEPVLLWTNPSPTSSFAHNAEIITIDQNIRFIEIVSVTKDVNNRLIMTSTGKIPIVDGGSTIFNAFVMFNKGGGSGYTASRTYYYNQNNGKIGSIECFVNSSPNTSSNDYLIPYRIYGYLS